MSKKEKNLFFVGILLIVLGMAFGECGKKQELSQELILKYEELSQKHQELVIKCQTQP